MPEKLSLNEILLGMRLFKDSFSKFFWIDLSIFHLNNVMRYSSECLFSLLNLFETRWFPDIVISTIHFSPDANLAMFSLKMSNLTTLAVSHWTLTTRMSYEAQSTLDPPRTVAQKETSKHFLFGFDTYRTWCPSSRLVSAKISASSSISSPSSRVKPFAVISYPRVHGFLVREV